MIASVLIGIVSLLHWSFLVLEMVFWTRPLGRKIFRLTPEQAQSSRLLAMNQGLYNGFLAAGLMTSLLLQDAHAAHLFARFFLICVIVAGIGGAVTVNRRIFLVQALPAIVALGALEW